MTAPREHIKRTTVGMQHMLSVAAVLVFIIGTPLFLLPAKTDLLFSWTVNPPLTAAFLGAAYWSSFALEWLCAREVSWAKARVAVPAVLLFTFLTLVATLLHIDKFHFGNSFSRLTQWITWVWLIVYAIVPLIMGVVLIIQMRQPGVDTRRKLTMASWTRVVFFVQASIMIILGVSLFLFPKPTASLCWPWMLSPLTGRAIGAWLIGVGFAAAHSAWENDWIRVRAASVAYALFGGLELVALIRLGFDHYPDSGQSIVDWSDPRIWIYVIFMMGILAIGSYGGWVSRRKSVYLKI